MNEPQQPPQRVTLFDRALASPVSTFLFALCVAVFFLAERSGSTKDTETLIRFGAVYRGGVWGGQWWRLFSSMFLHIGLMHLVWNIWAGFSWTAPFERVLGTWRFLFIYLLSGLVGSAASVIGHDAVSAGASGALFGVIGGVFVLMRYRLGSWRALWNEPSQRQPIVLTVVWLLIGPFVGFDSFAHGGGLLAGMGLTAGLLRGGANRLAVALFCCAVFIAASLRPIPGLHDGWLDRYGLQRAVLAKDWPRVLALTEGKDLEGAEREPFRVVRAHALLVAGKREEAASLLPTKAESDVPYLVWLHLGTGHPERALALVDEALKKSPRDAALLAAKLEVLERQGDRQALERLQDVIADEHAGSALGLAMKAKRLAREGQLEEALEPLEAAAKSEPRWRGDLALLLTDLGRYDEAHARAKGAENEAWLECYVSSVQGDFQRAAAQCESLTDGSGPSREVRALRLVGLGECDAAKAELGDDASPFAKDLRLVCAVRADGLAALETELAAEEPRLEARLLRFSVTRDLNDLAGIEPGARRSWLWPLLPGDAQRALPR